MAQPDTALDGILSCLLQMEAVLATIESQCDVVSRTAMASEKVVDQLRYGLAIVTDRCQRIRKDVSDWEVALKNTMDAQDQLDEAAACYAIPRFVDSVVRGEVSDPATLVKALVQLSRSRDYLDSKPKNVVGNRLRSKVTTYLDRATERTQQAVHNAVLGCIRSAIGPPTQVRLSANCDTRSFVNANGPLRMFREDWKRRLTDIYTAVEQLAIVFDDLKSPEAIAESFAARIKTYFKEFVTEDYVSKHEGASLTGGLTGSNATLFGAAAGRRHSIFASGGAIASLFKRAIGSGADDVSDLAGAATDDTSASASTYRQGDHPLIQFSRDVRQLAAECLIVYDVAVLKAFPTTEDDPRYHRQLALMNGPAVREQAFGVPSVVFIASIAETLFARVSKTLAHVARSPDVGIFDGIFIALDLLSECWQWRRTSRAAPGRRLGAGNCEAYDGVNEAIDSMVDSVMSTAHTLLDDYIESKGQLDEEELVRSTGSSDYFAVKGTQKFSTSFLLLLGLHSRELETEEQMEEAEEDAAGAENDSAAALPRAVRCRWLPSYDCTVHPSTTGMLRFFKHIVTCFEGIFCIAMAGSCDEADAILAKSKQKRQQAKDNEWASTVGDYLSACMVQHIDDLLTISRAASVTLNPPGDDDTEAAESPFVLFNRAVFMANNAHFVVRSLREDSEFNASARTRDMCASVIIEYETKLDQAVEEYEAMWTAVLPAVPDRDEHLRGAMDSEANELTKPQRRRVKQWYAEAKVNLEKMINGSKAHVVAQVGMRQKLSLAAAQSVEKRYVEFEETVVKGRIWTTNAAKYFIPLIADDDANRSASVATTVAVVRSIFPAPYTPSVFRAPGPPVEL